MLRDITLGQYYPGSSVVHKLDPRIKILSTILFVCAVFLVKNFVGYAFVILAVLGVISMSKIKLSLVLKGVKPLAFIIIFTSILNLFLTSGEIIWKLGFLKITKEGLYLAVSMSLRLILLVMGTSVLTFTTSPIALTDGIEKLLSPFSKVGLPAHEIAMMMSIALRFIPTLVEETDKIMKAQMSRGADFESGNILSRAKAMVPILVPLFIGSFRRADELATAMECRCYHGGEGRTRLKELKIKKRDIVALFTVIVFVTAIIVLNVIF